MKPKTNHNSVSNSASEPPEVVAQQLKCCSSLHCPPYSKIPFKSDVSLSTTDCCLTIGTLFIVPVQFIVICLDKPLTSSLHPHSSVTKLYCLQCPSKLSCSIFVHWLNHRCPVVLSQHPQWLRWSEVLVRVNPGSTFTSVIQIISSVVKFFLLTSKGTTIDSGSCHPWYQIICCQITTDSVTLSYCFITQSLYLSGFRSSQNLSDYPPILFTCPQSIHISSSVGTCPSVQTFFALLFPNISFAVTFLPPHIEIPYNDSTQIQRVSSRSIRSSSSHGFCSRSDENHDTV